MTCTHCGAAIRDGAETCTVCGASVKNETPAESVTSADTMKSVPAKSRKGNAGLLAGAIALIAVALLLIGGLVMGLLNGWFDDAKASEPAPSEGLDYILLDDGTYCVAGIGTCTDTHLVIPSTYEGASVTRINAGAFQYCDGLIAVTISDSVTSIGERAFYSCSALTGVTISDSVTDIGEYAFAWCEGLTSITIPASVTIIGSYVFNGCTNLSQIDCAVSARPYEWHYKWIDGCSATVNWNNQ